MKQILVSEDLLRQALMRLEINRTNFYKGPSKSMSRCLAGGNDESITALRAALEQPAVEPVAEVVWSKDTDYEYSFKMLVELACKEGVPVKLYVGPFESGGFYWHDTEADKPMYAAPQAQPAVEPFGHVTVRRLSRRVKCLTDQYVFYSAGQVPYLDNVDECHAVYTAPPPPADVPLLTDDEIYEMYSEPRSDAEMLAFGREVEQAVRQKAGLK